jgi:hypothetical protein
MREQHEELLKKIVDVVCGDPTVVDAGTVREAGANRLRSGATQWSEQ